MLDPLVLLALRDLPLPAFGAFAVVRVAQVAVSSRPIDEVWSPIGLGGTGEAVIFLLALLLAVVPLLGVAGSTGRTRQALVPPVVIVPRRRPLPGAGG